MEMGAQASGSAAGSVWYGSPDASYPPSSSRTNHSRQVSGPVESPLRLSEQQVPSRSLIGIGLKTPTPSNVNAQNFISPGSARSGPESPDPLNLISPLRHRGGMRAPETPSPRILSNSWDWHATQTQGGSFGLSQAMGGSMRSTLTQEQRQRQQQQQQHPKRRVAQNPADSEPPKPKKARKGPSPVNSGNFYSRKVQLSSTDESSQAESDVAGPSSAVIAKSNKPVETSKPKKGRASKESKAEGGASNPKSAPKPRGRPPKDKVVVQRGGTTFTSSLPLALPFDRGESASAEEWEKDGDYEVDSEHETAERLARSPSKVVGEPLQTPVAPSAGPAAVERPATSIIKNADRRTPMKKLLTFLEDLFEAEGALPDKEAWPDSTEDLPEAASSFFASVDGIAVVKPTKLHQLARLVRLCSTKTFNRGAIPNRSPVKAAATPSSNAPAAVEPTSLVEVDVQEMQKLLRILVATIRVGEGVDPFPVSTEVNTKKSPKGKKRGKSAASPKSRAGSSVSPSKSRSSKDEDEEMEDEEDAEDSDEDDKLEDEEEADRTATGKDSSKTASPKKPRRSSASATPSRSVGPEGPATTEAEQKELGEKLSRIATSMMAVDCCLSIFAVDALDASLVAEDFIRPCVEMIRSSLEQVIFPFVEACSNVGFTAPHPLLASWVEVLAPSSTTKAKRGRKKKGTPFKQDEGLTTNIILAGCSDYLAAIFQSTSSSMSSAQKLVALPSISLSETIIFSVIYAAMGPFFAIEPEILTGTSEAAKANARGRKALEALAPGVGGGSTAMKSLRLPALNLLRNIFARHPAQRQWMIEELLTSLVKLPDMKKNRKQFSLRNGKAINSITALLLQLVQTSAHGIRDKVNPKTTASVHALGVGLAATQREQSPVEDEDQIMAGVPHATGSTKAVDGSDYDLDLLRRALDSPAQASRAIATFLMNRVAASAKVTKSSGEFSYAAVVENLVSDLLTTLALPEWPASSLLLTNLCRTFSAVLDDAKSAPDAKGVALEHLGQIGAHLRESQLRVEALRQAALADAHSPGQRGPPTLSIIERERDVEGLKDLNNAYSVILNYLASAEDDDQAAKSAIDFSVSQWGSEVSASLIRTSKSLDIAKEATEEDARAEVSIIQPFLSELHESLLLLSKQSDKTAGSGDVFDSRSLEAYASTTKAAEQLIHTTSFSITGDFIRNYLVNALESQAVGNRTKALRGLMAIHVVDPSLMENGLVREAIETRMSDESSGVREAAVNILSKYLLTQPDDMQVLYEKLRERIFDAGLAVRKRTLKLLASIYRTLPSQGMRADACIRMVRCVNDEDIGVQDLAVQTLGEIWLGVKSSDEPAKGSRGRRGSTKATPEAGAADEEPAESGSINDDMAVIVHVAGEIRERPSPLEEVFRRFAKDRSEQDMDDLLEKLRSLSDGLINALDEGASSDEPDDPAMVLTRVKTIYLVVSTNPAVLSIGKAKMLLTHLKGNPQSADEASILELLLRIFRISLPLLPKTALALANQLETAIRPFLNNPPRQMAALQEVIACYTVVIKTHTENFATLIKTFGVLFKALQGISGQLLQNPRAPASLKSRMVMLEAALFCEKADFDQLQVDKPEHKDAISSSVGINGKKTARDQIFELLLDIRRSPTHSSLALQGIGFLFRGFPLLMISEGGAQVMEECFASTETTEKEMLLRILLDFLTSDSAKRAPDAPTVPVAPGRKASASASSVAAAKKATKAVDMKELVGNTDTFADSGVSSILVQRYLDPILQAAVAVRTPGIQRPAMDILKFVVLQGLSHPLQCMPCLISLETMDDRFVANRALALHDHLASKHGSILAARYTELIKSSFEFQVDLKQASLQDLRGYRIDAVTGQSMALLHAWYSLLREKRQTRLDFVKAMVKLVDLDTSSSQCSETQVLLSRYAADNLATLDYKTLEEVFIVIAELKRIISVSGAQVKWYAEEFVAAHEAGEDIDYWTSPQKPSLRGGSGLMDLDELDAPEDGVQDTQRNWLMIDRQAKLQQRSAKDRTPEPATAAAAAADRRGVTATARMTIIMGTALLLRNHLKASYGLSEERCLKYNPGKKQSGGADRPAVKKDGLAGPLSFDGMSLALDGVKGKESCLEQMATFEDLMDNEGTMAEDPDDWEE